MKVKLNGSQPLVETLKVELSAAGTQQVMEQQQQQQQQQVACATDPYLQNTAEVKKSSTHGRLTSPSWETVSFMPCPQDSQNRAAHVPAPLPHGSSEEAVHKAVEEAHSRLKGRFKSEVLCLSFFSCHENVAPSGVPGQSGWRENTMLGVSFLSFDSDSNNTEVKELKGLLELLAQESNEILDLNAAAATVERKTRTPPDTCISEAVCDECVEELREVEQD
ncbi:hypothetical protein O3P69_013071 [Scylla paramamosain]|uniref:Uncharacterized protein n=1 Tax=Scylla paramamosain TaxID=85552 RepID=A0AAW0TVG0_SCYPA